MNLLSITTRREIYKHDIQCFDAGHPEAMITARDVEGAGLCWPLGWLDGAPQHVIDKWNKFMYGQTFCEHGYYERDVRRFLFGVYRDEQPETD